MVKCNVEKECEKISDVQGGGRISVSLDSRFVVIGGNIWRVNEEGIISNPKEWKYGNVEWDSEDRVWSLEEGNLRVMKCEDESCEIIEEYSVEEEERGGWRIEGFEIDAEGRGVWVWGGRVVGLIEGSVGRGEVENFV